MALCKDVVKYCDELLDVGIVKDYCPNGLQVEGKRDINLIVSGVSASLEVIKKAIEYKADMLLVHHGFFWKGDSSCITGFMRERLKLLLENNINLVAYHLPLDLHQVYGNNVQLARHMQWDITGRLTGCIGRDLGNTAILKKPVSVDELVESLRIKLGFEPVVVCQDGSDKVETIAFSTGASYDDIHYAIESGVDVFITGEIAERTYHIAKESGIVFIAAGHYATEKFGIVALAENVVKKFNIEHCNVDIDCCV